MSEPSRVFVVLSQTGTLPSLFFKLVTRGRYNHTSLSLNAELSDMRSFGRRHRRNALIAGYIHESINENVFAMFNSRKILLSVLAFPVTEEQFMRLKQLLDCFEQNYTQHKYNFLGIMTALCKKPRKRKGNYFCSEFVAEMLELAGITKLHRSACTMRPADFLLLPNCEIVFEGTLFDFKKMII